MEKINFVELNFRVNKMKMNKHVRVHSYFYNACMANYYFAKYEAARLLVTKFWYAHKCIHYSIKADALLIVNLN